MRRLRKETRACRMNSCGASPSGAWGLPHDAGERSLNLATAVCAAVYEGIRQLARRGEVMIDGQNRLQLEPVRRDWPATEKGRNAAGVGCAAGEGVPTIRCSRKPAAGRFDDLAMYDHARRGRSRPSSRHRSPR